MSKQNLEIVLAAWTVVDIVLGIVAIRVYILFRRERREFGKKKDSNVS